MKSILVNVFEGRLINDWESLMPYWAYFFQTSSSFSNILTIA